MTKLSFGQTRCPPNRHGCSHNTSSIWRAYKNKKSKQTEGCVSILARQFFSTSALTPQIFTHPFTMVVQSIICTDSQFWEFWEQMVSHSCCPFWIRDIVRSKSFFSWPLNKSKTDTWWKLFSELFHVIYTCFSDENGTIIKSKQEIMRFLLSIFFIFYLFQYNVTIGPLAPMGTQLWTQWYRVKKNKNKWFPGLG